MTEQTKSNERLNIEIAHLRRENKTLSAELAFHRQVFQKVHQALGAADELSGALKKNEVFRQLAEENEKLKSQLKISKLSEREKEILRLIADGYTSKKIADELKISKLTVDTHRKKHPAKIGNI